MIVDQRHRPAFRSDRVRELVVCRTEADGVVSLLGLVEVDPAIIITMVSIPFLITISGQPISTHRSCSSLGKYCAPTMSYPSNVAYTTPNPPSRRSPASPIQKSVITHSNPPSVFLSFSSSVNATPFSTNPAAHDRRTMSSAMRAAETSAVQVPDKPLICLANNPGPRKALGLHAAREGTFREVCSSDSCAPPAAGLCLDNGSEDSEYPAPCRDVGRLEAGD
jgi:hypothetical protein